MSQYPYPPMLTPCWADLATEVRAVLWSVAELIDVEAGLHTGLLSPQPAWAERYWVGLQVHARPSGHHLGNLFLHGDRLTWVAHREPERGYDLADPDCFTRLVADLRERHRAFRRSLKGLAVASAGGKPKDGV